MDGYQVDIDELRRAEHLIREFGVALDPITNHPDPISPDAVGHADLASALAEFDRHSQQAARSLSADATAAAERLGDTAERYQHQEQALTDINTGRTG